MKTENRREMQREGIIWKQWRGRRPHPSWLLYLFGVPLILAGLFILARGFRVFDVSLEVPDLLVTMFGFAFLFLGFVVVYLASKPIIGRAKLDSTDPYQSDFPWSQEGISGHMEPRIGKTALGTITLLLFLVPIHYLIVGIVVSDAGIERILLVVVFGLFDIILLAHIYALINFG